MLFFKPISTCAVVGLAVAHHGLAAPVLLYSTSRGCSGSVFQAASGGYCTLGFDMFGLAADISRARQAPWGHGMRTRSVA
ncbi:hypothetical protein C8Q72DRAFT_645119 [Fomitopsis betulina]|nr:hypothetical protein C8Q72DRAFT_114148 [Fomitopsis betulina]KAI0724878.1 hypothetical protein C8Q72DRAFT_645119 [Fomitopsis betulina]